MATQLVYLLFCPSNVHSDGAVDKDKGLQRVPRKYGHADNHKIPNQSRNHNSSRAVACFGFAVLRVAIGPSVAGLGLCIAYSVDPACSLTVQQVY